MGTPYDQMNDSRGNAVFDAAQTVPNRNAVLGASATVLLGLLLASVFSAAVTGFQACGGDGGSPYAAPASPRGEYCDSGMPTISIVGGLGLAFIGTTAATIGRRWWPLVAGAIVAAVLILSPLVLGRALSRDCADKPPSMTAEEFSRYLDRRPECAHN